MFLIADLSIIKNQQPIIEHNLNNSMQNQVEKIKQELTDNSKLWLITGVAGFIGSHLLEHLLSLKQQVVGIDNFSTGRQENLEDVKMRVGQAAWSRFKFIEGDIRILSDCHAATADVDYILHQAALASVPLSIQDPIKVNQVNIDGFLNMLVAASDAKVKRFVYASSSAVYGNNTNLTQVEDEIGCFLSPYALTKYVNEIYANSFTRIYGLECIGLRYFNVFGSRQDPNGAYAAVIPQWFDSLLKEQQVYINGDGENTRDFCYINNVIQANILAACISNKDAIAQVYNIACEKGTSLNKLFELILKEVADLLPDIAHKKPVYRDFRLGDVRHSVADISKAQKFLGYSPSYSVEEGLRAVARWYLENQC